MTTDPPLTFANDTAVFTLHSPNAAIRQGWRQILGSFLRPSDRPPLANLHLTLVDALPDWPHNQCIYHDDGAQAIINVYGDGDSWWLHYLDGALVHVPRQAAGSRETAVCRGWITRKALALGRLEDVTFTSLAPILRRRGIFMLHAFAASRGGQASLIVGPSGSGKTTTGLWLLAHGWELLANDVIMLTQDDDRVLAHPTPNLIGIRPPTLAFLPELAARLALLPDAPAMLTADDLANGRFAPPAPVSHLYLLAGRRRSDCTLAPLAPSVVVARLMEESVDRWDGDMLLPHLNFLSKLAAQCQRFTLTLGDHPDKLAGVLPVEKTAV